MKERTVETFRIMDTKGNTINHITSSRGENVEKRKVIAEKFRDRWNNGYFSDEQLLIVPCDSLGFPIKK